MVCLEIDNTIHTRCLEILCNLTRLPSNNVILARNTYALNALTEGCGRRHEKNDRTWSLRALQNISADISSKEIISSSNVLKLLGKSALREGEEQEAAIAIMLNLSTDSVVIVRLMNSKKIVNTLLQLAHSSNASADIRIMSCDTLATMALRLQSYASAGLEPEGNVVTPLPTPLNTGWLRWN